MKRLSAKAKISGLTLIELVVVLAVLAVTSARADTNVIAVLTTADGIAYTNARIEHVTPVEAIVWFQSGIARVALTNLPPDLQKQYPYDAAAAEQFLAGQQVQREKIAAAQMTIRRARQAWMTDQARKAGWIYVIYQEDKRLPEYTAISGGRQFKLYLNDGPAGLSEAVDRYGLKWAMAQSRYTVSRIRNDSAGEFLAQENAKDASDIMPRVRAFDTGERYGGLPVWQFVAKDK